MKKTFSFFLAILMILSSVSAAFAEAQPLEPPLDLTQLEEAEFAMDRAADFDVAAVDIDSGTDDALTNDFDGIKSSTDFTEIFTSGEETLRLEVPEHGEKQTGEQDRAATVSDMVEINGNSYAVITAEGIAIAYQAPSDVLVLTQDYLRQAELYSLCYSNPLNAAAEFVEDGTHLNIYDVETGVDIYVDIGTDDWAYIYPDTLNMTDSQIDAVNAYFCRSGLSNANYTFGKAGENAYFFYDASRNYGKVYMFSSVGGYEIRIYYKAKNNAEVNKGLELLRNLKIVAM